MATDEVCFICCRGLPLVLGVLIIREEVEDLKLRYANIEGGCQFLLWENSHRNLTPSCLMLVDRDNTLVSDHGYVHKLEDLQIFPAAIAALKHVKSVGGAIAVITNQGGIALEKFKASDFGRFNLKMIEEFEINGVHIDFVAACPHHPGAVNRDLRMCNCRKPKGDMFKFISNSYSIGLERIAVFGDAETDIQFAKDQGVSGFRVINHADIENITKSWLEKIELPPG